jgi:hypothetical protein
VPGPAKRDLTVWYRLRRSRPRSSRHAGPARGVTSRPYFDPGPARTGCHRTEPVARPGRVAVAADQELQVLPMVLAKGGQTMTSASQADSAGSIPVTRSIVPPGQCHGSAVRAVVEIVLDHNLTVKIPAAPAPLGQRASAHRGARSGGRRSHEQDPGVARADGAAISCAGKVPKPVPDAGWPGARR